MVFKIKEVFNVWFWFIILYMWYIIGFLIKFFGVLIFYFKSNYKINIVYIELFEIRFLILC